MLGRLIGSRYVDVLICTAPFFLIGARQRPARCCGWSAGYREAGARGRLHHISRCVMKYVLQIVFALTSERCLVRETTVSNNQPGGLRRNTDEENNRSNINRRNWQLACPVF